MRKRSWAIITAGSAILTWWALASDDVPPAAPTAAAQRPAREPPDERAVEARKRRALRDLARRVDETRLVKVRAVDCGLMPATHAEVSVVAGNEVVAGLADETGTFRAQVPADATSARVAVRRAEQAGTEHQGNVSLSLAPAGLDGAAPSLIDIVICPGATVEGVVRDASGRPLADAVVRFGDGSDVAVTEADGEFVLTDTYVTAARVVVEHALGGAELDLIPGLKVGERREVDLVIEGGRRVVGQVIDARGTVVPNVPVLALDDDGRVLVRVTSDRDGRFWLKRLPTDALIVRADGGAAGQAEARVRSGSHSDEVLLKLTLDRASLTVIWEGTVPADIEVDVAGIMDNADPVAPARILLRSGEEHWGPTPAVYRARVRTANGDVSCGELLLFRGDRRVMRCGAPRESGITARVLGPDGAPRADVSWALTTEDGRRMEGVTARDGRLEARFVLAQAATATLEVGRPEPDVDMLSRRNIALAPGEVRDLGSLALRSVNAVRAMFTERETGTFGGLGGMLQADALGIAFARIVRDGPLDRAGVRPGDIVLDIDGQSAGLLTEREVTLRLRGTPGTPVSLRLMRPGDGTLEVELDRDVIDPNSGWVD